MLRSFEDMYDITDHILMSAPMALLMYGYYQFLDRKDSTGTVMNHLGSMTIHSKMNGNITADRLRLD